LFKVYLGFVLYCIPYVVLRISLIVIKYLFRRVKKRLLTLTLKAGGLWIAYNSYFSFLKIQEDLVDDTPTHATTEGGRRKRKKKKSNR